MYFLSLSKNLCIHLIEYIVVHCYLTCLWYLTSRISIHLSLLESNYPDLLIILGSFNNTCLDFEFSETDYKNFPMFELAVVKQRYVDGNDCCQYIFLTLISIIWNCVESFMLENKIYEFLRLIAKTTWNISKILNS